VAEQEPPAEPDQDSPVVQIFVSDSGVGADAASVTRQVQASDEARADDSASVTVQRFASDEVRLDDSASLSVAFAANLGMTATLEAEHRIAVGGVAGLLAADPGRVDSIVGHLDSETVDELWALLQESAEVVSAPNSDEERWRQLHMLWEREDAARVVEPALDALRDQIQALHNEIEALVGTVASAQMSIPRPEKSRVKKWGAILTLWIGSYLAGGSVGAMLAGDSAHMVDYSVALGAVLAVSDLYDRCVD